MFAKQEARSWPVTLPQIEMTVAAYLGPGRMQGNKQGECFSRQISMYLATHVGGWSTPQIGRFYNGRHHTTVLYAIEKIERLRSQEPSVDAFLEVLIGDLRPAAVRPSSRPLAWPNNVIDSLVDRILDLILRQAACSDNQARQQSKDFDSQEPGCKRKKPTAISLENYFSQGALSDYQAGSHRFASCYLGALLSHQRSVDSLCYGL